MWKKLAFICPNLQHARRRKLWSSQSVAFYITNLFNSIRYVSIYNDSLFTSLRWTKITLKEQITWGKKKHFFRKYIKKSKQNDVSYIGVWQWVSLKWGKVMTLGKNKTFTKHGGRWKGTTKSFSKNMHRGERHKRQTHFNRIFHSKTLRPNTGSYIHGVFWRKLKCVFYKIELFEIIITYEKNIKEHWLCSCTNHTLRLERDALALLVICCSLWNEG